MKAKSEIDTLLDELKTYESGNLIPNTELVIKLRALGKSARTAKQGHTAAVLALEWFLSQRVSNPQVYLAAVEGLGELGTPKAIELLKKIVLTDLEEPSQDHHAAYLAVKGIASRIERTGYNKGLLDVLSHAAGHQNMSVRALAAEHLGTHGNQARLPVLARLAIHDPEQPTRNSASFAMATLLERHNLGIKDAKTYLTTAVGLHPSLTIKDRQTNAMKRVRSRLE